MTKKATPSTPAEFEEYLKGFATPDDMHAALKDGSFKAAIDGYKNSNSTDVTDLKVQMREQAQLAAAEILERNRENAGPKLNLAAQGVYNDRAPGAGLNGVFEDAAEFFAAAVNASPNSLPKNLREKFQTLQNYSSDIPSDGGYLIPEEFRADIFSGPALESTIVRPRAQVIPMPTGKLKYPAIDFTTEVGEIWGGIIFYWMEEGDTITDTDPTFAAIELDAHTLAGASVVPNELLADANRAGLRAWIENNLPRGYLHFEDVAFLKGNGVKKPLGALHASNPALITVSKETGQTASTIVWENILTMGARLLPESWDNAIWVITPDAFKEVYTMGLTVGTGGSAMMTGEGQGPAPLPMTLLGRPIRWSRKAPATLGTKGDISLFDPSTYVIGDTQDVRVASSEHSHFLQNKTAFRVLGRVDGQPQLLGPLTPENGGSTLSAYVQLETRS